MNCIVSIEGRFVLREGRPASHHLTYERFWKRYLGGFDTVTIVGRLYQVEDSGAGNVEGPGVRFHALPAYTGPREFLKVRRKVQDRIRLACAEPGAAILRLPGHIGTMVWSELRRKGRPYGVEIVADPYDVFARGANDHPLRALFRRQFTANLRKQCSEACAAAYVTENALQSRYPAVNAHYQTHYSSVELAQESFAAKPKSFERSGRKSVVTVAMLEQPYKRIDLLLDAIAICRQKGADIDLAVVGDGQLRTRYEAHARTLGIAEFVRFHGKLPGGPAVRAVMDDADLFVLASRTEGLPRAMIEAMARGLPCIGTRIGGIPELLETDELVPPDDAVALSNAILSVVRDPSKAARLSAENLDKSRRYSRELLQRRREEFFNAVAACTSGSL